MRDVTTSDLLHQGEITVLGLLPYSSNNTLLVHIRLHDTTVYAVYKPQRGERPLWDFPHGTLYRREIAAYIVSDMLGFTFVPPTVVRHNAPYGIGSLQLYIHHNPAIHLLTIYEDTHYVHDIERIVAYDYLVNNADRKGGHCLVDDDGQVWLIDHGLCFHAEHKLRTVLWHVAENPLPQHVKNALQTMHTRLYETPAHDDHIMQLQRLLSQAEYDALLQRLDHLLSTGTYPSPGIGVCLPWPPV